MLAKAAEKCQPEDFSRSPTRPLNGTCLYRQLRSSICTVEAAVLSYVLLGLGAFFAGWEVILILAVVLILFGAKHLPDIASRLGGEIMFRSASEKEREELERRPPESGVVFEALTHNNRSAEFIHPREVDLDGHRDIVLFVAQGFGIGKISFAPGTFGSLAGLVWLAALVATTRFGLYLAGCLCGVGLSVWLCGAAEKALKQKDPPSVVLDEIVALPFCFLPWVTHEWLFRHKLPALESFFTGRGLLITLGIFILFRILDITKPWPLRQSQRLEGGWGVILDDLLAATCVALLTLFFIL